MKNILYLISLFFFSCTSLEKEYNTHLKYGLDTYPYTRDVNLNFVPGLSIKSIAFLNKSEGEKMLVIRLNDNALVSDVKKYSLGIKTFLNEDIYGNILNGKEYISTPTKPNLLEINKFKYIIEPYTLKVKKIDKIEFILFDRDKFRKVLGKPIAIRNMGI